MNPPDGGTLATCLLETTNLGHPGIPQPGQLRAGQRSPQTGQINSIGHYVTGEEGDRRGLERVRESGRGKRIGNFPLASVGSRQGATIEKKRVAPRGG